MYCFYGQQHEENNVKLFKDKNKIIQMSKANKKERIQKKIQTLLCLDKQLANQAFADATRAIVSHARAQNHRSLNLSSSFV